MRYLNLLLLLFVLSCTSLIKSDEIGLPFYNSSTFTPEWIEVDDEAYKDIHLIEDFEFVNQLEEKVDQSNFEGKIYVANFFFTTCPGICPKMTNNLKIVYNSFLEDEDVLLLSHTVMPWVDDVSKLKEYADLNGIKAEKWCLVTGAKQSIYSLARESYFADEGFGKTVTSADDFLHTENVFLIDRNRRIRGVYNGALPLEMRRLVEDVVTLKKE